MKTGKTPALEIDALQLKKAALHLRAINHPLRQQMIHLLHKFGRLMVTTIYVKLRIEQSVASQHLAVLRRAKLVRAERDGKKIYYEVNYQNLERIQNLASELVNP